VEIDNVTYFIDGFTGYKRDDAKIVCESMNMTMISFEGDEQKWQAVNKWLSVSGITKIIFQHRVCIFHMKRLCYQLLLD
jgi:hypothetical protein